MPTQNEYSSSYKGYVELVSGKDIMKTLEEQFDEVEQFFNSIPQDKAGFRYNEGKWSIREILGHMSDTERIFAYRALRISRKDRTALPGFDENEYVRYSNFDKQTMSDLLEHFLFIRKSTIAMFKTMDEEMTKLSGTVNNNQVSVRAIAHIIAGHAQHHINIIKERYL
jgi:uncharacterized damage-inducible protein DinB